MNGTNTASGSGLTTSWRTWVTLAAGGWGAFYTLLGIYWWVGGPGYPFGRNDLTGPENGSLLSGVDVHTGAPAIVLVGLAGVLTAWVMDQRLGRGWHRWSVVAAGSTIVTVLLVVAIDARSMTLLPPLGLLGWALIRDWPTFNQLLLALGAVLWIAATTTYVGVTRPTPRSPARQARTSAREGGTRCARRGHGRLARSPHGCGGAVSARQGGTLLVDCGGPAVRKRRRGCSIRDRRPARRGARSSSATAAVTPSG